MSAGRLTRYRVGKVAPRLRARHAPRRVLKARAEYREQSACFDLERLKFVDEAGVNLALTRLFGRAPRGERVADAVPQNYGENVTLLGALSLSDVEALEAALKRALSTVTESDARAWFKHCGYSVNCYANRSRWRVSLEKLLEFFGRQPRIPHDAAHRERVHRIMARDREDADAVRQNNMLALPNDPEAGLLQSLDRIQVVDAGNLRHG